MNFKTFQQAFELIELNFNFQYNAKLLPLVYEQVRNLSDEDFKNGVNRILSMTRTEWAEKYDYGKTPTIADWKNLLSGNKNLTEDQQASVECEKIMQQARYPFSSSKFDNPITQRVVDSFTYGLKTINYECHDSYNPNKLALGLMKRNLVEKWKAFADMKTIDSLKLEGKVKNLIPNLKIK